MRKRLFKLVSLILVFVMLATVFATTVSAKIYYSSGVLTVDDIVNPLTSGEESVTTGFSIDSKKYYGASDFDDEDYTDDEENVVRAIRAAMVGRKPKLDVYYKTMDPNSTNKINEMFRNWIDKVLAETENSNEGDYLHWVYENIGTEDNKVGFLNIGKYYYFHLPLEFTYYTTRAQEDALDKKIEEVIDNFDFDEYSTPKQKSDVIYEYITKNVEYDYDNLDIDAYKLKYTAYAALINGTSVCQGYATLFYRLARECGLDARVITGTSRNQNHAWNIVKIGSYYYYLDSTWDAGEEAINYKYYLKGSDNFIPSHTPELKYTTSEFTQKYPISASDMDLFDDGISNDFEYYTYMDKVYITDYIGDSKSIIVPATIGECPVVSVGNSVFSNNQNLESVIFSEGIKKIENEVLLNCDNLLSVIIPDSVTEIGTMFAYGNDGYTIYGAGESKACEYALNNQINFKEIDDFVCINGHTVKKQYITEYAYHNECVVCGDCAKTHALNAIEPLAYAAKVEYEYYLYNGKRIEPKIVVFDDPDGNPMVEGVDYVIVAYRDNVDAGLGYIEVKGIGKYAGIGQISFEIKSRHISEKKIGVEYLSTNYDGTQKCPYVKIEGLDEFKDFSVEYSNNVYPGTANAKVTAWGNYAGELVIEYEIKLPATKSVTTALYGHNDVKLSWNKVSGAKGYFVYYKKASSKSYTYKGSTTSLSYNLANLTSGTKYDFKVVAYYLVGNTKKASTYYKTTSATTLKDLKAPSKVITELYGYDDVKVSWKKVSNAKGYYVYYKKSSAKSYSYAGKTTSTSFKKSNLSDGVKYTFKVVPYSISNGKIILDDSYKTASVTTLKKVATPKISKSSKKVKVSWTNISGESGYQISQSTSKSKTKIVSTYNTTSGKSKTISAKKGKTYYYKVRAFVKVGKTVIYGPWSSVKKYKLK